MLVCCEHGLFRRRDRRISKRATGDADQLRHALRLPKHGRSSCRTKVEDHVLSCERVASEGLRGAINNRHCATFERGGNAKQLPVRRRKSRQWHIETRVGSPWQLSRSLPAGETGETFGDATCTPYRSPRGPAGRQRVGFDLASSGEIDQRKGGLHPRPPVAAARAQPG
jgi:hypothetical protein